MADKKNVTDYDKWKISLFSAFLFLLVANVYTYRFVHNILGKWMNNKSSNNLCPSILVTIICSILFLLLVRISMEVKFL